MATKKLGLGRGLDALLGGAKGVKPAESAKAIDAQPAAQAQPELAPTDGSLRHLPVEFIQPGKYQPRQDMRAESLEELANSIKTQGVMQPIVVRPIGANKYEIIAGERRWRATQL